MTKYAMMLAAVLLLRPVAAQAECQSYGDLPLAEIVGDGSVRADAWAEALAPIIEGRRIVMLGEPSHGDGASIYTRSEIAQVLHERFDFDVLIFEADFYALTFGWTKVASANDVTSFARGNVYSFWSNTPAAVPLWSFIARAVEQGRQFDVAGVDIRLRGELSRAQISDELARIATSANLPLDANARRGLLDLLHNDLTPTASEAEKQSLHALLRQLTEAQTENVADQAIVRSLLSWAQSTWYGDSRDIGMAANLRWLADHHFPDRKIIVWAHSNHELRDQAIWDGIASPAPRHMGNLFAERREADVAVIGTIADGGQISSKYLEALNWKDFDISETTNLRARSADSIESYLAVRCAAPTVLRLPRGKHIPSFKSSAIDYVFEVEADFSKGFDALVYVGRAQPLNWSGGHSESSPPN